MQSRSLFVIKCKWEDSFSQETNIKKMSFFTFITCMISFLSNSIMYLWFKLLRYDTCEKDLKVYERFSFSGFHLPGGIRQERRSLVFWPKGSKVLLFHLCISIFTIQYLVHGHR